LLVVDVGARGGFERHWSFYGDQVELIGFEPESEECKRLNQQASGTRNRYFPVALGESTGKRTFYVTRYPPSSGFYKPDMNFWHRFADEIHLSVVKEIEINTADLDHFAHENGLGSIGFMKLDVEGAELSILKGAKETLGKTVFGLSIEVEFYPCHEGQPLFSDVDAFVRSLGFVLFDLSIYRHNRKVWPDPRWISEQPGPTKQGQVMWGQAVYLRDAVHELETDFSGALEEGWDDVKILKLASIMELFGLSDCVFRRCRPLIPAMSSTPVIEAALA